MSAEAAQDRKAKARQYSRRYYAEHREAVLAKAHAYYAENREEITAKARVRGCGYRAQNREELRARSHAYYARNREEINAEARARYAQDPEHREELNARNREWRQANREHDNRQQRERRAELRRRVLKALGGKCVRCGFDNQGALCISRIHGGRHRHSSVRLREALSSDEYQLLCANCCMGRRGEGDERHASEKAIEDQQRHAQLRQQVLDMLGGKCVRCGITDLDVLAVDHVDEDGAAHRRVASQTIRMREALADAASGRFQLLCHCCNALKYRETIAA